MRIRTILGTSATAAIMATALPIGGAVAMTPSGPGQACVDPHESLGLPDAAKPRGGVERHPEGAGEVSTTQARAIAAKTQRVLSRKNVTGRQVATMSASIPVYVHVMQDKSGGGNVTDAQIADQIAVLNKTFGGGESASAANTGFTFQLAGTTRYRNNRWHQDRQSTQYRSQTRQGGANALNIWFVDFGYAGVATWPWDYASAPDIDGIRVHYASVPGGSMPNYNLGKTATHEAGHWLGLFHTFQGGCTETNDQVADTPAQSDSTYGCPEGRDSCSLPGLDPIHNYMDYSFDLCYTMFTSGQSTRMNSMWAAYRAN